MQIKDILTDLAKITKGIGFDIIRVTGDDKETTFRSASTSNVIMNSSAKKAIKEFEGKFGLGNLDILRGYLDIYNSYDSNTSTEVKVVNVSRNGVDIPAEITFKANGQSSANYRLNGENSLPKLPVIVGSPSWDIVLDELSKVKILEFQRFANVMRDAKTFTVLCRNNRLIFQLGDDTSSISRAEVDMGEISGKWSYNFSFPITDFLILITNNNSPIIKFSNKGLLSISIDTGLISHEFLIVAKS